MKVSSDSDIAGESYRYGRPMPRPSFPVMKRRLDKSFIDEFHEQGIANGDYVAIGAGRERVVHNVAHLEYLRAPGFVRQ